MLNNPAKMDDIDKLKIFIGTWEGSGEASYPSITNARYFELLVFDYDDDKSIITYTQSTKYSGGENEGTTLHKESGFILKSRTGGIDLSNSQGNGRVEVLKLMEYTEEKNAIRIVFRSKCFGNDERMIETERIYQLKDDSLFYEMKMSTDRNFGMKTHLKAQLKRID